MKNLVYDLSFWFGMILEIATYRTESTGAQHSKTSIKFCPTLAVILPNTL